MKMESVSSGPDVTSQRPVLKHSAESLIAKTTPTSRTSPAQLANCDPTQVKSAHDHPNSIHGNGVPGSNDTIKSNRLDSFHSSFIRRLGDSIDLENQKREKHVCADEADPRESSNRSWMLNNRASTYSTRAYSTESEFDSLSKYQNGHHQHNHHLLPHQHHQHHHREQQSHYHHLLRMESEKRDIFEKENRFLQEQKLLCKDSRSPPNVTVCQRSPIAHSLFPMCHPNLFDASVSAFHHPMTSLYINTVTSHSHILSHIPPSTLSSIPSSITTPPSSSSPPHRSPTRSSVSNPHHPQSLPSSHPAAMARALAASALPLSYHLAFSPRQVTSLGQAFQTRSSPSRYHPYAPNPVSPGIPSSPDGGHSRSSTPSPASSPMIKGSPNGVMKPVSIPREIGLNLTTSDSRVVPV